MSQLRGKLRQKIKNGPYYYRLMVANGTRKEFALKTCDFEEACRKAADMDAGWDAPTKDVAIAQITAMKGFSKKAMNLPLSEGWGKYQVRAHDELHSGRSADDSTRGNGRSAVCGM